MRSSSTSSVSKHPRYEIKTSSDSQFYFNLIAANNEVVLTSERYTAKHNAHTGIESVRVNGSLDARFERRSSQREEPYFVLRAANHQVIGTSEMYSSPQARDNGIEAVKKIAQHALVFDHA